MFVHRKIAHYGDHKSGEKSADNRARDNSCYFAEDLDIGKDLLLSSLKAGKRQQAG